jgi:ubiquitin C-terminal hydrolase
MTDKSEQVSDYFNKLNERINEADEIYKQYTTSNNLDKLEKKKQFNKKYEQIESLFSGLDFILETIDEDISQYTATKASLKDKAVAIKAKFDILERKQNAPASKSDAPIDYTKLTQQEAKQIANNTQNKSKEVLQNIERTLDTDINEQNSILQLLREGSDRIEYVDRNISDIDSTLKRVKVLLRYFARQVSTDRLLLTLIILAAVGILVAIFVKVFKKKSATYIY